MLYTRLGSLASPNRARFHCAAALVATSVDASTTPGYDDAGSGLVNCQFGPAGLWECFRLVPARGVRVPAYILRPGDTTAELPLEQAHGKKVPFTRAFCGRLA